MSFKGICTPSTSFNHAEWICVGRFTHIALRVHLLSHSIAAYLTGPQLSNSSLMSSSVTPSARFVTFLQHQHQASGWPFSSLHKRPHRTPKAPLRGNNAMLYWVASGRRAMLLTSCVNCVLCTVEHFARQRASQKCRIWWNGLQSEAVLGATQALLQRAPGSVIVCKEVMLPLDALAVEHCWVHWRLLLFTLVQCWNCQKQAAQLLSARSSAGLVRSCLHDALPQHACLCCRDAWPSAEIVRSRLHDTLPRDARASRPCCGLHAARAELNISRGLQLLDAHAPGSVS
jgi:hypothetical protein